MGYSTASYINVGIISYIVSLKEMSILELFFRDPMGQFHVRELGRNTGLNTKTIMKYLKGFVKKKIILRKVHKKGFPFYEANRHSALYRYEKSQAVIKKIYESGLIEYLERNLNPKAIVLFGSIRKGTYHEKSDVDLFIQSERVRLDLSRFENKLGHKTQLLFEKNTNTLSKGLLQAIYNGIVISGALEL